MSPRYRIALTKSAERDLAKLDKIVARRIVAKLRFYEASKTPLDHTKQLQGLENTYRFRIGDYRAVFELHPDGTITILLILRIKHRKDVYR